MLDYGRSRDVPAIETTAGHGTLQSLGRSAGNSAAACLPAAGQPSGLVRMPAWHAALVAISPMDDSPGSATEAIPHLNTRINDSPGSSKPRQNPFPAAREQAGDARSSPQFRPIAFQSLFGPKTAKTVDFPESAQKPLPNGHAVAKFRAACRAESAGVHAPVRSLHRPLNINGIGSLTPNLGWDTGQDTECTGLVTDRLNPELCTETW